MTELDKSCNPVRATPAPCRVRLWQALVFWWAIMFPLAFWGLPSTFNDELLFGGEPAWPLERYQAQADLEQRRERIQGADTDLNPVTESAAILTLTQSDADRAEILRRYRLFSRQPDEMITFMALQRMNPAKLDFDPRLYQYGGAYIYLIGAALGLANLCRLVTLTGDVGVYLNRPELFAWFYVIARLITLLFGALTLAAAVKLAQRVAGRPAGWAAFFFVACSPLFITGALEAKPHLPAVGATLWAIIFALDLYERRRPKDARRLGVAAGSACGLVLTGWAAAILWPALFALRSVRRSISARTLLAAGGVALLVFLLTNPYIFYNALANRPALLGNLDNSTAMYRLGNFAAGAARVAQLLLEGCGPAALLLGVLGLIGCARRWPRHTMIACAPPAAMILLCVSIGAGKPAEFARFLLLPAAALLIAGAIFVVEFIRRRRLWGICAFVLALVAMRTPAYLRSFYLDARQLHESRRQAGVYLHVRVPRDQPIGVLQAPAPYAVPPLDFSHREIRLLPRHAPVRIEYRRLPEWIVLTADDEASVSGSWWYDLYRLECSFAAQPRHLSRVAWANKPVYVYRRDRSDSGPVPAPPDANHPQ